MSLNSLQPPCILPQIALNKEWFQTVNAINYMNLLRVIYSCIYLYKVVFLWLKHNLLQLSSAQLMVSTPCNSQSTLKRKKRVKNIWNILSFFHVFQLKSFGVNYMFNTIFGLLFDWCTLSTVLVWDYTTVFLKFI